MLLLSFLNLCPLVSSLPLSIFPLPLSYSFPEPFPLALIFLFLLYIYYLSLTVHDSHPPSSSPLFLLCLSLSPLFLSLLSAGSVFKSGWLDCPPEWHQPKLAAEFDTTRSVRSLAYKVLSSARDDGTIRSFTEAEVAIATDSTKLAALLKKYAAFSRKESKEEGRVGGEGLRGKREGGCYGYEYSLSDIFIVSSLSVHLESSDCEGEGERGLGGVKVYRGLGEVLLEGERSQVRVSTWRREERGWCKCPRCWLWTRASGDEFCERCAHVLADSSV